MHRFLQTFPSKERHLVQPSYRLMALSPLRDGERIMGAGSPRGTRGFGEFQPGLERESVPSSFLIHTKLNIYEHASLKVGNSAAYSVLFSPLWEMQSINQRKGFHSCRRDTVFDRFLACYWRTTPPLLVPAVVLERECTLVQFTA